MKKVTIVTPVYKVERYIADCIESVINQTYPSIELVLVDDCGGDGSVDIIEQYIERTHRAGLEIRLIRHKHNEGVAAARTHAMQAATGDYIFCLDSDDTLKPDCISHLVDKMEQTDADFVVCGHCSDAENSGLGGHLCAPVDMVEGNDSCIHALAECWFNVAPWCKLLKRSFVEQYYLYFREGIINEDAPWTFQLCLNAQKIAFLDEDLYYYRYNGNSIMSSSKQMAISRSCRISLDIYLEEILNRKYLWNNRDVYILWMRQVVLYFTLLAMHLGLAKYVKEFTLMKKLRYDSLWFNARDIPLTYRIWNVIQKLPTLIAGVITYCLIRYQNK